MRGGLDDALARMARLEELRRRAADPPTSPGAAVEEVVQAARRAVGRDPELSVALTVGYRGRTSTVRVQNHNGEVLVSVAPGQPARPREVEAPPPPAQPSAASQLAELLRQPDPD